MTTRKKPLKPETKPETLEKIQDVEKNEIIEPIKIPGQDFDLPEIEEDEEVEYVEIPVPTIKLKKDIIEPEPESEFLTEDFKDFNNESNSWFSSVSGLLYLLVNSVHAERIIKELKPNELDCLAALFTFNFTTKFSCKLPKGISPKYKIFDRKFNKYSGNLFNESANLAYLIKESHMVPREYVRNMAMTEAMLEDWLETLTEDDANVVLAVKDRELEEKYGITLEIVKKFFPQLVVMF